MRNRRVCGIAIALAMAAPAVAAPAADDSGRADIVALAHQAMDALNKGDLATVKTLMPAYMIIDEVPPFVWSGRDAIDDWLVSVDADNTKLQDSGSVATLGSPTYIRVEGDQAYAVFPERFRYKRAGHQISEGGVWTFNARKSAAGWRIIAWTYSAGGH